MKVHTLAQNVTDNLIYWQYYMAFSDANRNKEINMEVTLPPKKVKEAEDGRKERQQ